MRLYLVASKPTDGVTHGFLPAAVRLGLDVTVLTDQPAAHDQAYRAYTEGAAPRTEYCDVWDHRALIAELTAQPAGDAIFSNSDHLQSQTALAADYLGLPGKDWRSALRAKHKPLMRRTLADAGIERVRAAQLRANPAAKGAEGAEAGPGLEYPVVLKPVDGIASEDVILAATPEQFREHRDAYLRRHPHRTLLAEEYLPGPQRTLETLGDDVTRWTLGGFRTTTSKPPFFAEERLDWDPPASGTSPANHVEAALDTLGVSFGAAHTEYVTGEQTRLIEVNDRVIGDHCEFLLAHLTGLPLFDLILRVHLGERLPAATPPAPPPGREHAAAVWVLAEHSGPLTRVPPASRHESGGPQGKATVTHWPMRRPGEEITVTGTNRDYLGVICAVGPDPTAVDRALDDLRENLDYRIKETA